MSSSSETHVWIALSLNRDVGESIPSKQNLNILFGANHCKYFWVVLTLTLYAYICACLLGCYFAKFGIAMVGFHQR